MSNRMRLVGWNVQPVIMVDNGESLLPVHVSVVTIPAADWDAFKGGGDLRALEDLKAKIEAPPERPQLRTQGPGKRKRPRT